MREYQYVSTQDERKISCGGLAEKYCDLSAYVCSDDSVRRISFSTQKYSTCNL